MAKEKGYLWTGTLNGSEIQLITQDEIVTEENSTFGLVTDRAEDGVYFLNYNGFRGNITGMTIGTTPAARVDYNKVKFNVTVKYVDTANSVFSVVEYDGVNVPLEDLMEPVFEEKGNRRGIFVDFYNGDIENSALGNSDIFAYHHDCTEFSPNQINGDENYTGTPQVPYDFENGQFSLGMNGKTVTIKMGVGVC